MDREGFRNRLKQYKQAREENPGLKYYDFMERLAEFKAQEWGEDSDEILTHMLNDNTYNYKQMYKDNPNFEIKEGHFKDTYKTVYHPTFSNESIYSGNKSEYNPRGTIGGRWIYDKIQERNEYRPSYSQVVNDDFDYATTSRYIENSSDTIDDYYKDIKERAQNIGNLSNYATLTTYYPFISRVPYTGHSQLTVTGLVPNHQGDAIIGTIGIDKGGHNEDYNLITNNCSDATRCGLEHTFDKKINPFLFTTPGDVQDFALDELNAIPGKKGDQYFNPKTGTYQTRRISDVEKKANRGKSTVYIPINKEQRDKLIDFIHKGDKEQKFADGGIIPKYDEGGRVIPTQEEYITQQIDAKKAAALKKSYDRQYPKVPTSGGKRSKADWENSLNQQEEYLNTLLSRWGITPSQKTIWQNNLKALQSQREAGYDAYIGEGKILGPSCAYTTGDNYGIDCVGSEQFRQNHADYGFREIPYSQVQPSDVVLDYNPEEQRATHTMMYSKKGSDGVARFNHSNGGHTAEAIRKDARYPFKGQPLAYEFVGTPADSTQWINDYKKLYGFAEGGEVEDNDFMKQFGKQVSYKPEETSWWSNVKNWWNDLTGMKNYAYGNCATTPNGKHTEECAHYSNSVLRNQGYKNIIGDAWTRAANSGMKKIISGYDGLTKPAEWDESDAHDYLQSAANNFINNVDTTALNPYDVIGLYYPDSPNTKKAFEQGRWGETQTHTGHIAVGNDGTHYVVHNVGGHLKMNKLADMLTGDYDYLPVSAYRPKK